MSEDEPVVVFTTGNMLLLECVKEALQEAGIPYVVHGAGVHGTMALGLLNASGSLVPNQIVVLRGDAERASEIITGIQEGRPAEET